MADWNAEQYLKFEDQRTRPARDLAAQVPLQDARVVFDLGCGPGNSTEVLKQRFPAAAITGVDSSPDMLAQARKRLPDLNFIEADLRNWWPPSDADLLYSNATFQWVPNHLGALTRLFEPLKPGGVLAVQMPDNLDEPSHASMRDVAADGPWRETLVQAAEARDPAHPVSVYYDRLKPLAQHLDIWHTYYQHPLDGADGIIEWVKGTGLRPYIDPLPPEQRAAYLAQYKARLQNFYPPQYDGKTMLRFPRLFIIAVR